MLQSSSGVQTNNMTILLDSLSTAALLLLEQTLLEYLRSLSTADVIVPQPFTPTVIIRLSSTQTPASYGQAE